jgi:HME family heavy-metal exporter
MSTPRACTTTRSTPSCGPSGRGREEILNDIRAKLDTIPGVASSIGQPISHRIDHVLSGVRAQVAVKVFGTDLTVLRTKAAEVEAAMKTVRGMADIFTEPQVMIPQVHVRVDRDQAQRYGLMAGEVAEYAELAMQGKTVSQVLEGNRTFDVVLRLTDQARNDVEAIRQIPVDTSSGVVVPLGQLAQVEEAKGPNQINREDVQRPHLRGGQCLRPRSRQRGQRAAAEDRRAGGTATGLLRHIRRAI